MKILLDTNVVIDFLERRYPFYDSALAVINSIRKHKHSMCIAAHSIDNIVYILRKKIPMTDLLSGLEKFLRICSIVDVNETIIQSAVSAKWKDLEDAIQYFSALEANVDLIVTRDGAGYEERKIRVLTPVEAFEVIERG